MVCCATEDPNLVSCGEDLSHNALKKSLPVHYDLMFTFDLVAHKSPAFATCPNHVFHFTHLLLREKWTCNVAGGIVKLTVPKLRFLSNREYSHQLKEALDNWPSGAIDAAVNLVGSAYNSGSEIWVMGNGGSALAAQHCATDWTKNVWEITGKAARVQALVTDGAGMSAWANDLGFEGIFENQLKALGAPGDLAVFISGSGSSPNILRGARWASQSGFQVITFSRQSSQELHKLAHVAIEIPTDSSQVVNDLAHVFCHIVMFHLQNAA